MVMHFLSRFHRTCGGWHEHVECPMCRSILIYTPSQTPRSLLTFPFAKNRIADAAVAAMVDQLTAQIEGAGIPTPCEGMEQTKAGIKPDCENPLAAWRMGGPSRIEWLDRREYVFRLSTPFHTILAYAIAYSERESVCVQIPQYILFVCADVSLFAEEVDYLSRNWSTITSHEFIRIKDRLAV